MMREIEREIKVIDFDRRKSKLIKKYKKRLEFWVRNFIIKGGIWGISESIFIIIILIVFSC